MTKIATTAGGLALALGLSGGCAGGGTAAPVSDPVATHAAISQDLERLRALDVFQVGRLILDLPEEATACYGAPCAGFQSAVAQAEAEHAPRLARLTDDAAAAVEGSAYPVESAGVAADLESLRALRIVEVGALITTVPANNPNCYNLPCEADKARADAENRARAGRLAAIVAATRKD